MILSGIQWPSLAVVRNPRYSIWRSYPGTDLPLKCSQLVSLAVLGARIAHSLVAVVSDVLLGVEALGRVELQLEPLTCGRDPTGVDPLVLIRRPMVLAVGHLVSARLEHTLDVRVGVRVSSSLGAEGIADRVSYVPYDFRCRSVGRARLGQIGDLLLEAVVAFESATPSCQAGAAGVVVLDLAHVLADRVLRSPDPGDYVLRPFVLLRAQILVAAAAPRPGRIT